MPFTKSETNPNAAVGGGCIGMAGVKTPDCVAPYFTAEGVVSTSGTCPRIVLCEYHRSELNRTAEAAQIVPAGYGQRDEPVPPEKPKAGSRPTNTQRAARAKNAELSL